VEGCSKRFTCHCERICFAQVIASSSKREWCDGQQVNDYTNLLTLTDQLKWKKIIDEFAP
jgi:hypothetical protein